MEKWMKFIGLVQIVLACSVLSSNASVAITNVVVTQRNGTKLVDVTYDIVGDATNAIAVCINIKNGTNTVPSTSCLGDVGGNVLPSTGLHILWNMGSDWNGNVTSGLFFTVNGILGGDPAAVSWEAVNAQWVKNTYSNGHVTMSDKTTGKMWTYNTDYMQIWGYDASSFCSNLVYAGYDDWVLPSRNTLEAQYSQKIYFTGFTYDYYWSSEPVQSGYMWEVSMKTGIARTWMPSQGASVWPMRNGQIAPTGTVQSGTAITGVDSRNYTLTVASIYGAPIPILGTNTYSWYSTITCSVASVVNNNGTNYTCIGWTGTGYIPAAGSGNTTGLIVLTNLNSSITWNWQLSGDLNNDEIPDTWAYQYSGNATGVVASADDDHDGYTNYQEYRFGTDPTNDLSRFEFSCRAPTTNNYARLYFTTTAGRDYTLEYRISLTEGTWQPLVTLPGSGSPLNLKDYNIGEKRFYRVNVNMAE